MERFDEWDSFLCHHGIKGQKWGVRNYQNADGSLTAAGKERYGGYSKQFAKAYKKDYKKYQKLKANADVAAQAKNVEKYNSRAKKAFKTGLALAAAGAGSAHGASRLLKTVLTKGDRSNLDISNKVLSGYIDAYNKAVNSGNISDAKGASSNADVWFHSVEKQHINIAKKEKAIQETSNAIGIGLSSVALAAIGVSAYNKYKAHVAKTRMSDIGHAKATARLKAYEQKMINIYGQVEIGDILATMKKK